MNINKQLFLYFIILIMAFCGFIFTIFWGEGDSYSFWNGLATGLIFICILRIYLILKYKTNENFAKKIDVKNNDERNRFLAERAKGLAFYFYIVISGALIIGLKVLGFDEASSVLGFSICGLVILYLVIYFVIRKKY